MPRPFPYLNPQHFYAPKNSSPPSTPVTPHPLSKRAKSSPYNFQTHPPVASNVWSCLNRQPCAQSLKLHAKHTNVVLVDHVVSNPLRNSYLRVDQPHTLRSHVCHKSMHTMSSPHLMGYNLLYNRHNLLYNRHSHSLSPH